MQGGQRSFEIHHWDGTGLTNIKLPGALKINRRGDQFFAKDMCTASDGRVFVAGKMGELLVGGRDGFTMLHPQSRDYHKMMEALCWFKGTLYGSSGVGLSQFDFEGNTWKLVPFAGDPFNYTFGPYLDANENIMLMAGATGATLFDGENWTQIAGV